MDSLAISYSEPYLMPSVQRVGEEDIAGMLFSRKDSGDAAKAFLNWLKGRGGKCTKSKWKDG